PHGHEYRPHGRQRPQAVPGCEPADMDERARPGGRANTWNGLVEVVTALLGATARHYFGASRRFNSRTRSRSTPGGLLSRRQSTATRAASRWPLWKRKTARAQRSSEDSGATVRMASR